MPKKKVAITLDRELVEELDELVAAGGFPSRSQAIELALSEKLERLAGTRLAREAAKLYPEEEKALAEEGIGGELEAWPEY
jgi:metal-responsive CopG/Arc/MetJ family transcriptional regulator